MKKKTLGLTHLSELMRLWYLSHRRPAKSRQSLCCSHSCSMEDDKGSGQNSDIKPHWMAEHARLKNDFREDEKDHNIMT